MSDRLPSGRTTSNNIVPRRLLADITTNERPSNGCRSRRIVTERAMSWRWVVCSNFLRFDSARRTSKVGGSSHCRHVLRLIKLWLKAPIEERDDDHGTRRMSGGN